MKTEEIKSLFTQFENASVEVEGVECWSARELQNLLGYTQWRNFENIIDKAKDACKNAGENVPYHFADVSKTIPMPKGAEKEIGDILLTRYACKRRQPQRTNRFCTELFRSTNTSGRNHRTAHTGLRARESPD
jgi:hypothetical protein